MLAVIQSLPFFNLRPASFNFTKTTSKVSGRQFLSVISPPVAATAHKNVPVSIRSGMMEWLAPFKADTPSITKRSLPIPEIFAPIFTKSSAKSDTSGSRAAFSSTVVPSAKQAAMSKFSVPVTVIMSVRIALPCKRGLPSAILATINPLRIWIPAPIALRPLICWSTGRAPIAQPPGNDTVARPIRASNGPNTKIDARIVLTNS